MNGCEIGGQMERVMEIRPKVKGKGLRLQSVQQVCGTAGETAKGLVTMQRAALWLRPISLLSAILSTWN